MYVHLKSEVFHAYLAISKSVLTIFSDSPRYLEVSVEELTLKKVVLHSEATALASIVLPVPGGPVIRMPFQGRLMPRKKSGMMRGRTTASWRSDLAASRPAMSFQPTPGLWLMISPVIYGRR